jgi:cell division protein FtsI/penicillin-binding protein 2
MRIASALTIVFALLAVSSTNEMGSPFSWSAPQTPLGLEADYSAASPGSCTSALAQRAVCLAANRRALEIINARRLKAIIVVQDVTTGALVAFAASHPSELDVNTHVYPLSVSKLLVCASLWDHELPDSSFENKKGKPNAEDPAGRTHVSAHDMLVGGSDSAGMQMAIDLRKAVGTNAVLEDFKRYGFPPLGGLSNDDSFWGELNPAWKSRLMPGPAYVSLDEKTKDVEWAETLSIGERNMQVTALHISLFLQSVGNNGLRLTPVAKEERSAQRVGKSSLPPEALSNSTRAMSESTALRLQSAMRDTVQRGTARSIATALSDTGWQIGGKTGSGTALLPKGLQIDGWFAGLIFDPNGKARFTIATFVRSGGYGGENAAKISAELARYIVVESGAR